MEYGFLVFVFALALACAAGMEFVYMMFLESQNRQLRRRVKALERQNAEMSRSLEEARTIIEELSDEGEHGEAWPELIDDK